MILAFGVVACGGAYGWYKANSARYLDWLPVILVTLSWVVLGIGVWSQALDFTKAHLMGVFPPSQWQMLNDGIDSMRPDLRIVAICFIDMIFMAAMPSLVGKVNNDDRQ